MFWLTAELSPSQTIATFQRNISQHWKWRMIILHDAMIILHFHLQPQFKYELFHIYFTSYRNIVGRSMLRTFGHPVAMCCDVLRHVGCCWLKFETGQIFHVTFVDVAWCCSRLARFVQQCCTRACALVRFSMPKAQDVATGWPNAFNMLHPQMLRYVVLKCCDRLARE